MKNSDLRYWLALLRAPGIGASKFAAILAHFPNLEEIFHSPHSLATLNFPAAMLEAFRNPDWKGVDLDLSWLEQPNHHILTLQDLDYPALLKQIADPPALLFIHGNAQILAQPQLAIVGSRNPSPLGLETAQDFARYLVEAGLIITSGLALGIDAASHQGALQAKGKTLAVMGTSLEHIYPKQHRGLAEKIIEQGALVSEFPLGTPALAENFPRRNRIVSGLCVGTLVVEATLRSGSLITARLANEQGREVFAIPGSIHNPLARGCHALIKQGAKLVETATDIIEELHALTAFLKPYSPPNQAVQVHNKLDEDYRKLVECLGFETLGIDTLVERSGFTVNEISSMLLVLELQGYVTSVAGGYLRV